MSEAEQLRAVIAHIGCAKCLDEHMNYAQSVSCYCDCHNGEKHRWTAARDLAVILGVMSASKQDVEAE